MKTYKTSVDLKTVKDGVTMDRIFLLKFRIGKLPFLFRKSLASAIPIALSLMYGSGVQAFVGETNAWKVVAPGATLGSYRHGTYPSWGNRTHVGIDLLAECGTPVRAYQEGVVTDVIGTGSDKDFRSLGYMVILEHTVRLTGKKLYTLYLHMAAPPSVSKGKVVAKGDKIGLVGTTGSANGTCHTHFEIRYFPVRFSAWGNIYGSGDKRNDAYFRQQWEDPMRFEVALNMPVPKPFAPVVDAITISGEASLGSGCGCYFTSTKKSKRPVFVSIDKAMMHIDGRDIVLQHVKGDSPEPGRKSRQIYSGEGTHVQLDYLSGKRCEGMECEVTEYQLSITVKTRGGETTLPASGECGC